VSGRGPSKTKSAKTKSTKPKSAKPKKTKKKALKRKGPSDAELVARAFPKKEGEH
jgi:hypothetical protein